ncbi:hypothetical protein [Micromonospora craterilacus]|uniref:hypothetical protein n=1 Tax=Micromonospora craterilacus TaxID=1655439 RepID=UPI001F35246A|nr:hypothetical protein [Micromonospora craterilacus]
MRPLRAGWKAATTVPPCTSVSTRSSSSTSPEQISLRVTTSGVSVRITSAARATARPV